MSRLNLLITGISGFIGRSLVEEIVNRNLPWNIHGIDIKDPYFNDPEYLKNITFDTVDIRDQKAVEAYFANKIFDGIIHLAAVSRVVDAENDKKNCVKTNYYGTQNVLECIARNPGAWMVFGSSREVYGEQTKFPVNENADKRPKNIYGVCKLKGEMMVKEYMNRYAILRFSNVYGNNYDIPGRVIPSFVRKAIGGETLVLEGGRQIIDFTYIDDTVNCIIKTAELLQSGTIEAEELHICRGEGVSLSEVVGFLQECLGKELSVEVREPRDYDVQNFMGDITKREKVLGPMEFSSIRQSLQKMVNYI